MKRLFAFAFVLMLSGCFEINESSDRVMNEFSVSKDRVYLAVPQPYTQFGLVLSYRPIQQGQFKKCNGRADCDASYVIGAAMGATPPDGRMDIYIGPEGQRYRIISAPYERSGRFAYLKGWSYNGVSETNYTPEEYTHILNIQPGAVHVVGRGLQATPTEIGTVKAILRQRFGADVDHLSFRSVEPRRVSCKSDVS
ncbi:hypothetical protein [Parasulfitobacter algicola]|uniref:DUF4136 domain-containing protein n=1 Tax=Parasulfitobacter algicola TaxID=2614809 RepID=A0ABX2IRJ0_9RHOB|nr:hypothetical protein [Sulfitobacter algicola]NSX55512.1 hypothetical protein [Sulfitobacter algicola]